MKNTKFINFNSLLIFERIVIYGYGSQGITLYEQLSKQGRCEAVVAFIDSYSSAEHKGIPVYRFNDVTIDFYSNVTVIIASTFWREIVKNFDNIESIDIYVFDPALGTDAQQYYQVVYDISKEASELNIIEAKNIAQDDTRKIVIHGSHKYTPVDLPMTLAEEYVNHFDDTAVKNFLDVYDYDQVVLCPHTDSDYCFFANIMQYIKRGAQVCVLKPQRKHIKVFIIEELSCIYFPVPKCASSSILHMLQTAFSDGKMLHESSNPSSPLQIIDVENFDFSKYFTFTFVRDPFKRLASLFKGHFKPKFYMNDILCHTYSKDVLDFSDFVNFVEKCPDYFSEQHFRSQYTFISNLNEKLLVDFIGDLEHFDDYWNILTNHINIPSVNTKKNASGMNDSLIEEYYTTELKEKVQNRYATDFILPRGFTCQHNE